MEANDFWTHIGLATAFLVTVVAPRMFNPDYATSTTYYLVGAAVVIGAATFFRFRARGSGRASATDPGPAKP